MLAGVLKYKRQAEELLESSGLPWTIIRPSRLTDGPYTSYDLNTLLKATSGTRQVCLSQHTQRRTSLLSICRQHRCIKLCDVFMSGRSQYSAAQVLVDRSDDCTPCIQQCEICTLFVPIPTVRPIACVLNDVLWMAGCAAVAEG